MKKPAIIADFLSLTFSHCFFLVFCNEYYSPAALFLIRLLYFEVEEIATTSINGSSA